LRLGYEFEHLNQDSGGGRLYFKDGLMEEHAAVVGADGIRSKVRTELFGFSGSGLSIEAALRRYESLRLHRTKHIQRSLLMGYIGQWQAPLFVNGRNIVTRMLPARLIERNLRRVYSYAA
jgi:2-polyprenyl-6-methoxyphenol hydroxylase-like FAD-dependent oxidoreductase